MQWDTAAAQQEVLINFGCMTIPPSVHSGSQLPAGNPVAALAVHRTAIHYRDCASLTLYTRGNEPTAAGGGGREASEWQRPRCPALPVADEAGHKRVQRSADEEGACHRRRCRVPQTDEKNEEKRKPEDFFGHRNRRALGAVRIRLRFR